MSVEIKTLQKGDEGVLAKVADDVFDDPIDLASAERFLADPCHYIAVALDAGLVVGFASAVHYVHPDKPSPELFVIEVGVAPSHQRQGIAKRMLAQLFASGQARGCKKAWVLTEPENAPALALYKAAGGDEEPNPVMFSFSL